MEKPMDYNTSFRTALRDNERREIKRIASSRGMTLTGYVDSILRKAIEEEKKRKERR